MNLDDILLEWSYKCPKGYPTMKDGKFVDKEEVIILNELLVQRGFPTLEEPNESIKEEEKVAAGDFEQIAVDLWNIATSGKSLPSKYKVYGNLFDEMVAITKRMKAKSPLKKFSGQRIATSDFWIKNSGGKSKDEPKTDIISNDVSLKVSVKKGASQLMSPEKKEAIATFKAVAVASGLSAKAEKTVLDILNKFADRTVTMGFNTRELSQASAKDLTGDKINKKAKQVYDLAYQAHKQMEKELNNLFANNKEFERSFLFEAASGYVKFGNNDGTANYLLAISDDAKHVKLKRMFSSKDEAITSILGKVKVSPSMKSNSYKKEGRKAGYGFYSSLRIHLSDVMEKASNLTEIENKLLNKKDHINEAWYTDLLGKVKTFLLKLWNKLINIAKMIASKLELFVEYIKTSFNNLLEVAEVEPDVSDDVLAPINFY